MTSREVTLLHIFHIFKAVNLTAVNEKHKSNTCVYIKGSLSLRYQLVEVGAGPALGPCSDICFAFNMVVNYVNNYLLY